MAVNVMLLELKIFSFLLPVNKEFELHTSSPIALQNHLVNLSVSLSLDTRKYLLILYLKSSATNLCIVPFVWDTNYLYNIIQSWCKAQGGESTLFMQHFTTLVIIKTIGTMWRSNLIWESGACMQTVINNLPVFLRTINAGNAVFSPFLLSSCTFLNPLQIVFFSLNNECPIWIYYFSNFSVFPGEASCQYLVVSHLIFSCFYLQRSS